MIGLIQAAVLLNLLAALGACAAPFVVRRLKGPRAASLVSKLCTATALASAIASIVLIRLSELSGLSRYLVLVVPLTILAGITCVYWTIIGLMYAQRADLERTLKERMKRAASRRAQ